MNLPYVCSKIYNKKMKAFRKSLLFVAVFFLATTFASSKVIKLKGTWGVGRSVTEKPIKGNIEGNNGNLQLDFLRDLGNVVVTISDARGNIVYQQGVFAEEGIPLIVSLEELSVREGIVSVSDGNNTVWGEFSY